MIKVLIVDDSAVVRKVMSRELSKFPDIEVVGTATDPFVARDKILALRPDVLTLDIEMPRMDGLTFLGRLLEHHPMPVIVVSSLTPRNSDLALKALSLGAVDVAHKPNSEFSIPEVMGQLVQAIRAAPYARVVKRKPAEGPKAAASPAGVIKHTSSSVVVVGSSTGGVSAIETFLAGVPPDFPGCLIAQHMPAGFTASLAERLDGVLKLHVREALDGMPMSPGCVFIAPAGRHAGVVRQGAKYVVKVKDGPPVNRFRPSVDVLFHSAAKHVGSNAVGIILTGMGDDGARGLAAMRQAGAATFAEDESTCTVFGMPKAAIEMGGVGVVAPIHRMAESVVAHLIRADRLAG